MENRKENGLNILIYCESIDLICLNFILKSSELLFQDHNFSHKLYLRHYLNVGVKHSE